MTVKRCVDGDGSVHTFLCGCVVILRFSVFVSAVVVVVYCCVFVR